MYIKEGMLSHWQGAKYAGRNAAYPISDTIRRHKQPLPQRGVTPVGSKAALALQVNGSPGVSATPPVRQADIPCALVCAWRFVAQPVTRRCNRITQPIFVSH